MSKEYTYIQRLVEQLAKLEDGLHEIAKIADSDPAMVAYLCRALLQPIPPEPQAGVELTDEILKLFDSAIDATRSATDSKWSIHQAGSNEHDCRMRSVFESMIIEKRRAIERAINQRQAVKAEPATVDYTPLPDRPE